MIDKLNISQIDYRPIEQEKNISRNNIVFKGREDTFVKDSGLNSEVKIALVQFLSSINFSEFINDLIQKNNFGGLTAISVNCDKDENVRNVSFAKYDIDKDECEVFNIETDEFLDIVQEAKAKQIEKHPDKNEEYEHLYVQLVDKLTKKENN